MLKESVKVTLILAICLIGSFISYKLYNHFNQDFIVAFLGGGLLIAISFVIDAI